MQIGMIGLGRLGASMVVFDGMPVNVTWLLSREQMLAADLDPKVASVSPLFVNRWDVAAKQAHFGFDLAHVLAATHRQLARHAGRLK